jgi:hypothetical protein
MRGCVHGRLSSLPLLLLLVLLLGALAPTKAAEGDRFLTNLALLDVLADDAVEQVLDSLGVAAGDSIGVLADGYNEGNAFIADAFARSLARRGCKVRMLVDVAPAAQEPEGAKDSGTAPSDADSTAGEPGDEEDGQDGQPGQGDDDQIDQDDEDQAAALDTDPFDQDPPDTDPLDVDPFADDTTSVSDSTQWGMPEDSLATGDGASDGEEPDSTGVQPEDREPEQQLVGAGRAYPPGTTLEFQILEFGVTYPEVKKRLFVLGTASIGRLAGVYLQVRKIEGPGGEIVQVASGRSHHRDRLSGQSRILAEGAGYPFTQPEVPAGRIGRLAEPIVVVAIISSLVYLFYQNQN